MILSVVGLLGVLALIMGAGALRLAAGGVEIPAELWNVLSFVAGALASLLVRADQQQ